MDSRYYNAQPLPAYDNYIDRLRLCNGKTALCLLCVGLGSLSVGYSWYAVLPAYISTETLYHPALSDLIFYISDIGGILGALLAGFLCDRQGRRLPILIGATINVIATVCLAVSVSLAMFLIFRFLLGIGISLLLVSIPVLIAETAPPKGRAILSSVHPILILLGNWLPAWIEIGLTDIASNNTAWKVSTAIGCLWPILCILFCRWLPESPRWLLRNGKADDAWRTIAILRSSPGNVQHDYARLEYEQISRHMNAEGDVRSTYARVLMQRSSRKRVFIACALNLFVATSGVSVITTSDFQFWGALGYETSTGAILREFAWVPATFGMSFLALFIVEKMPRRSFITTGFLGCHATLIAQTYIVASTSYTFYTTDFNNGIAKAGIAITYIFGFFFAVFLFGSRFFYAAEILPNQLRAKGIALAMATLCLTDAVTIITNSYALPAISWKYFIVFIVLSFVAMIFTLRMCPDSRNIPLEDIGRLFGDNGPLNNRWNIPQQPNVDENGWAYGRPIDAHQYPELDHRQERYEAGGGYRHAELYGMQAPAEAYGNPRHEMAEHHAPAQLGGGDVYECPGVNSRGGSHRR